MSVERVVISLLSGAAFTIMMGSSVASACEPSGWFPAAIPPLPCLAQTRASEGFDLHNDCAAPVEIAPEGCGELCPEAVLVAPNATVFLAVPAPAKDGDRQGFDYKTSEQSGTLEFTYTYTPCPSYDDGQGCSAASAGGRSSAVHQAGMLIVFLVLLGRQRRRHRAPEHK